MTSGKLRVAVAALILAVGTIGAGAAGNENARALFNSGTGVKFDAHAPVKESGDRPPQVKVVHRDPGQFVGLSYTIYEESINGQLREVDPGTRFQTNDRIMVEVSANAHGVISVANVNPAGEFSFLGEQQVEPGRVVRVPERGFLRFVGNPGQEKLIFLLSAEPLRYQGPKDERVYKVFTSCESTVTVSGTRTLVADDSAGNEFRVIREDGNCVVQASEESNTRSLVVDVSEKKGYGVVPAAQLSSGSILALGINLYHD